MIVLDASALLELLLGTDRGRSISARIADPALAIHSPHLVDVEVTQALRRYVREGELDFVTGADVLENLCALDLQRHAHEPLLRRIWELRHNLTAYDAAYVALAEALDATLLTCDRKLAAAPGLVISLELTP